MKTELQEAELLKTIMELRKQLHGCAELSGSERCTMELIKAFLETYSDFTVVQREKYLYANQISNPSLPNIAFRADMDAIPSATNIARHGCGHDGHTAILAGLAVVLSKKPPTDKNVYLIFQHAEEIGSGACEIVADGFFERHNIQEIYGLHNIPGVALGKIVSRENIFACTSKGLTIKLVGKPSHAAYPEYGINPVYAFADLVNNLKSSVPDNYKGLVLYTIVHLAVGQKAFGTAAATGELSMTIRAEYEQDLFALEDFIKNLAEQYAAEQGLLYQFDCCDYFPETGNHAPCLAKLRQVCTKLGLEYAELAEPMRWSEDFGYYTKCTQGTFFGVGAGTQWPQLHTEQYEFNDAVIATGLRVFATLAWMDI